jgi:hypothetical protein
MPSPWVRRSAIASRSANCKYRPDGGFADDANPAGGIPPASRNQRVPTAGDTPATDAASSLVCPVVIAAQNCRRSSRCAAGGRPGDRRGARPDRSDRRFGFFIATSFVRPLRRPLESALTATVGMMEETGTWPAALKGHGQGRQRQFGAHMIPHRPADHLATEQIDHDGEIQPSLVRSDVGEIGGPDAIRRGWVKVALQAVGRDRPIMVTIGRANPERAGAPGLDAVTPHQTLDAAPADGPSLGAQGGMDTGAP